MCMQLKIAYSKRTGNTWQICIFTKYYCQEDNVYESSAETTQYLTLKGYVNKITGGKKFTNPHVFFQPFKVYITRVIIIIWIDM